MSCNRCGNARAEPLKSCSCDVQGNMLSIVNQNKLIQFLKGLNEVYEYVKSQILVLEPLPSVNRAYSMILKVEKQKSIQNDCSENLDNSVMMLKTSQGGYGRGN